VKKCRGFFSQLSPRSLQNITAAVLALLVYSSGELPRSSSWYR